MWRGWNVVIFEDQGKPHIAFESKRCASELDLRVRYLPKAVPELNAMDQLWRHVKRDVLSDRTTEDIDISADVACSYILSLSNTERLKKSGCLSGNFWLY